MGLGGISIWQLLIIALIVVLLFGTKKLKNLGGDLGGAVKGFKKAMADEPNESQQTADKAQTSLGNHPQQTDAKVSQQDNIKQ